MTNTVGSSHELDGFLAMANDANEVAKTAARNGVSLAGENFYSRKFHVTTVQLRSALNRLKPLLEQTSGVEDSLTRELETICAPGASTAARRDALRATEVIIEATVKPELERRETSSAPATEQVLPLSVVTHTRKYFEAVITQANGCYEHQWYDACSVMIRRFVETLVVEVYDHLGRAEYIKDANGEFCMLGGLIERVLADRKLTLGRESKKVLPIVKQLGDRAAHNRRYVATKRDVDAVVPGLRVLADDLLHLGGMK